jgi:hypothetical protein
MEKGRAMKVTSTNKFSGIRNFCCLLIIMCWSLSSHAVLITSDVSSLGGSSYQYDFSIENDDLAAGVEAFAIYFDYTLFESLTFLSSPSDWDTLIFDVDASLPDDGILDSLFLNAPLALGQTLSGFSVTVDWLGQGEATNALAFDVYDAFSFNTLFSSTTRAAPSGPITEASAPGAFVLLFLGLAVLVLRKRRFKA